MALCVNLLHEEIQNSCTNPIYTGYEPIGYLINKSEIASYTYSNNAISAITLTTGAKAYRIYQEGATPFNGTKTEMAAGTLRNRFNKTVSFILPEDGATVNNKVVEKLANGEFVVILASKWEEAVSSGDNKFEVIGINKGCKATELSQDKNADDIDGAWQVTMQEANVPIAKVFFFTTDVATSRAALEALC